VWVWIGLELRGPPVSTGEVANALNERAFAHLMFRGFDAAATEERIGAGQNPSLLRALFPEQDFVIWRADAF
jgi:hypothetical protein